MLSTCSAEPAAGQLPRQRLSSPATNPSPGNQNLPRPDAPIPTANIVVDGQIEDWAAIPVRLRPKPGVTSSYKPTAVRVAANEQFVYFLIELGLGVRERFDQQLPSGRVSSGALGHLRLTVDGTQYSVWLPTGFSMETPKGRPTLLTLQMSYELGRQNSQGKKLERLLTKEYPIDQDFIAIEGKYVEIKIPLETLAAKPTSSWTIAFDPM